MVLTSSDAERGNTKGGVKSTHKLARPQSGAVEVLLPVERQSVCLVRATVPDPL